jgi:predicted transcriptional regulator
MLLWSNYNFTKIGDLTPVGNAGIRGRFGTSFPRPDSFGMSGSSDMRIAVSIGDELLRAADEAAHWLCLSRSRFFAVAVADFLEWHRKDEMQRRLDEVYAGGSDASEERLLRGIKTKFRSFSNDQW